MRPEWHTPLRYRWHIHPATGTMMKVRKDLLKFVMLERAAAIISLSWIRGLIFVIVTGFVVTTKLLKIKHLSKFFKHCFRDFLTLFRLLFKVVQQVSMAPRNGRLSM